MIAFALIGAHPVKRRGKTLEAMASRPRSTENRGFSMTAGMNPFATKFVHLAEMVVATERVLGIRRHHDRQSRSGTT